MRYLIILLFTTLTVLFSDQRAIKQHSFHEDFSSSKSENFNYHTTGTPDAFKHSMGIQSPTEAETNILSFKLNPSEIAGPGRGPEIISKHFTHFGSYSTRIKVPAVVDKQPNIGAVVGYFTYHENPEKGLSEIDFEWLLADPRIIYVGTWTGELDNLQRVGRIINLAEGKIIETISKLDNDIDPTPLTGLQNIPESIVAIPDYDASSKFYTYGFDWKSDRIRWWMIHPETADTVVLWDYQGSQLGIPQHESKYRMNLWHTKNWTVVGNPKAIEKPEYPFELEIDWMEYKSDN